MKAWTTKPQHAWLEDQFPQWRKARRSGKVAPFFEDTVNKFFKAFPETMSNQSLSSTRVRKWFYNHKKLPHPKQPHAVAASIDFKKPQRKLVSLTHAQAYSIIHCKRGSSLYKTLHGDWKKYKSGDPDTIKKYQEHFTAKQAGKKLPFVTFQQAIFRDTVESLPKEELNALDDYIRERLKKDTIDRERPWQALKTNDETDVDLERQYVKDQIDNVSTLLDNVAAKVKSVTNFNTLVLTGGPNPLGTGGMQLLHVTTGEVIATGQTFDQFLGPLWDTLKAKYGEWLTQCYSRDEVYCAEGSVFGPFRTSAQSSKFQEPSNRDEEVATPPTQISMVADDSSNGQTDNASDDQTDNASDDQTDDASDDPDRISHSSSSMSPSPPRRVSPSPPRAAPPSLAHGVHLWDYIQKTALYLLGVPGGHEWKILMDRYLLFEGLSSARSGTHKMPTNPRPEEISLWFKWGRRLTGKGTPVINSIEEYREKWIEWWSAAQPQWRDTEDWPFDKEDVTGKDWGHLVDGGKDGMYLVIVSLAWWICAQDSEDESALDEAIKDITWVINNLISWLEASINFSAPPRSTKRVRLSVKRTRA